MAVCQLLINRLNHRDRGQAPSHIETTVCQKLFLPNPQAL